MLWPTPFFKDGKIISIFNNFAVAYILLFHHRSLCSIGHIVNGKRHGLMKNSCFIRLLHAVFDILCDFSQMMTNSNKTKKNGLLPGVVFSLNLKCVNHLEICSFPTLCVMFLDEYAASKLVFIAAYLLKMQDLSIRSDRIGIVPF